MLNFIKYYDTAMSHVRVVAARRPSLITSRRLLMAALLLTSTTCLLALLNWAQDYHWQFDHMTFYQLFPVLGLLAFSIMWSQYVIEAAMHYWFRDNVLSPYFQRSSWAVLGLIVLHPGLLIVQRYRDGFGLPPGSYESYVAPMVRWVTILGTASMLLFLAFELRRFFGQKTWWKYVIALNDVAIVAISYHGLRLGKDLGHGWYRAVWFGYIVILLGALTYKYIYCFGVTNRRAIAD